MTFAKSQMPYEYKLKYNLRFSFILVHIFPVKLSLGPYVTPCSLYDEAPNHEDV